MRHVPVHTREGYFWVQGQVLDIILLIYYSLKGRREWEVWGLWLCTQVLREAWGWSGRGKGRQPALPAVVPDTHLISRNRTLLVLHGYGCVGLLAAARPHTQTLWVFGLTVWALTVSTGVVSCGIQVG